jgi:hypothetical protein
MNNKVDKEEFKNNINKRCSIIFEQFEIETDPVKQKELREELHKLLNMRPLKDSIKDSIEFIKKTFKNDLGNECAELLQKALDDGKIK